MTALNNLRLKLNGVTPPNDEELALAAKELGMDVSEVKLMIERAQLAGMSFKSYKSTGGTSKLLAALKAKKSKPGVYRVDHNLNGGMVEPPVVAKDEESEEIPDAVKEAAKIMGMEAQQLFDMVRIKSGIAGGVPDGSETRAKRRQRMSQPDLKSAVRGKLLSILHPDFSIGAVRKAVEDFSQAEKEMAMELLKSVTELFDIPLMSYKSTGSLEMDAVYDSVAAEQFRLTAVKKFGKEIYAKMKAIGDVLNPQPMMDQFTSKALNNQPTVNTKYLPLAEQNKLVHPLVQAEMSKLPQTALKALDAKTETEQQTAVEHAAALHDAFTSTMLNPQLLERVKEISDKVEVAQARFHDMFTSKRLNRDRTPEVQVSLKEAQHGSLDVEQAQLAKEAARLRQWQASQPPRKERGAPFLSGKL